VKRLLAVSVVVIAAGVLATGCNVTPQAASINGTNISTSTLNTQLHTLDSLQAGQCLLEAETGSEIQTTGTGGTGTFDMNFADLILQSQVTDTLAAQLAASKGLTISSSDLATAKTEYEQLLAGEISQAAETAQESEAASFCVTAAGQALTAAEVVGALPKAVADQLIRNNAVDQQLLADGADITPAQILAYYNANQSKFTTACVSALVTDTQAHAEQFQAQINGGTPFATVAKANSLDATSAANGGALGCNFTVAEVEQALSLTSLPVNTVIGPISDPSSGAYELYEVTSQTVAPLSEVTSSIVQELQQSTANSTRVSKEILAFAHTSDVWVNPQYGTWKLHRIVAPVRPAANLLLAAASGASGTSLDTGTGTGTGSPATSSGS
jgi:parvulin-like peptidyl-prolyl isomerase